MASNVLIVPYEFKSFKIVPDCPYSFQINPNNSNSYKIVSYSLKSSLFIPNNVSVFQYRSVNISITLSHTAHCVDVTLHRSKSSHFVLNRLICSHLSQIATYYDALFYMAPNRAISLSIVINRPSDSSNERR